MRGIDCTIKVFWLQLNWIKNWIIVQWVIWVSNDELGSIIT